MCRAHSCKPRNKYTLNEIIIPTLHLCMVRQERLSIIMVLHSLWLMVQAKWFKQVVVMIGSAQLVLSKQLHCLSFSFEHRPFTSFMNYDRTEWSTSRHNSPIPYNTLMTV